MFLARTPRSGHKQAIALLVGRTGSMRMRGLLSGHMHSIARPQRREAASTACQSLAISPHSRTTPVAFDIGVSFVGGDGITRGLGGGRTGGLADDG